MRLLSCVLASAVLAGCTSGPPKRKLSTFLKPSAKGEREVREILYNFVERFSGEVSETSYSIEKETTDPVIRRRALMWKMNAIPTVQQAAFDDDALAAFADVWAFTIQMREYFEDGAGKDSFGPYQSRVVETSRLLESEITNMPHDAKGPNAEFMEKKVRAWAAANPIDNPIFTRNSLQTMIAAIKGDSHRGAVDAVRNMDLQIEDLSERLTIYARTLPVQARWQAEFLLSEALPPERIEQMTRNLDQVTQAADRATAVAESVPQLVERERLAAFEQIGEERVATLAQIDGFRQDTLKEIRKERVAVLEDVERQRLDTIKVLQEERGVVLTAVDAQRLATLEFLKQEREAIVEVIKAERAATTSEIDDIVKTSIDASIPSMRELIDHALWRVVLAGGVLIGLALAAALAYRKLA